MSNVVRRPRRSVTRDHLGSMETFSWGFGPVAYLAMEAKGEFMPIGRPRWLRLGSRICVAYGPEDAISEGLPDNVARCRWLNGGRRAVVVTWSAATRQERGGADAER